MSPGAGLLGRSASSGSGAAGSGSRDARPGLCRARRPALLPLLLLACAPAARAADAAAECVDDFASLNTYARDFADALGAKSCAQASQHCEHMWYGPLVRLYCPATCGSCAARPPTLSADLECADRHAGLSYAYQNCSAAQPHCSHPAYGRFVRASCPVECDICGHVDLDFTAVNVQYGELSTRPELLEDIYRNLRPAIMQGLPQGITEGHLLPSISPATSDPRGPTSVLVRVVVPKNMTAASVDNVLSGWFMPARLLVALRNVTLIAQATSGLAPGIGNHSTTAKEPAAPLEALIVAGNASQENCSDNDTGLVNWASSVQLSLRGCMDVIAGGFELSLNFSRSLELPPLSLDPASAGYCHHAFFGPEVRRHCHAACKICDNVPPESFAMPSGELGLVESVPLRDLEVGGEKVSLYVMLHNLNHTALVEDSVAAEAFRNEVKRVVAAQAGALTTVAHVRVEFSPGSANHTVDARAEVTPPQGETARNIDARLRYGDNMSARLQDGMSGHELLKKARLGDVAVLNITTPFTSPAPLSSLSTCANQHWTASEFESREYYIAQMSGPRYGFAQCQEKCAERPGGRLLSCIEDKAKFDFLKENALKAFGNVWVGLLQPYADPGQEPLGGWRWTGGCQGYSGLWFAGHGPDMPRQPDNFEHKLEGFTMRENCAVLLQGHHNATIQAFDVPCEWHGRKAEEEAWIPDRCLCESPLRKAAKVPMCTACRAPIFPADSACKYEAFGCTGVAPGESCEIKCKPPYVGVGEIYGTCPDDNYNPFRFLRYSRTLECGCPAPPLVPGYTKVEGRFRCADGYTGTAAVRCPCGGEPELHGCAEKRHCVVPAVDKCRQDASDCTADAKRYPGSSCVIRCRDDPSSFVTASCPSTNTDPARHLDYYPLRCTLTTCADPPETEGYNKTAEGWVCADGYYGVVRFECLPNATGWTYPACSAVGQLSGCQRITTCGMAPLPPVDACKIDASGCQDVQAGSTCELKCRFPFEGFKTIGICPEGNIDPLGLVLNTTLPACTVIQAECDKVEPNTIPAAYTKTLSGWTCSTSYTGFAEKTCVPNVQQCDLKPVLSGCSQLMPCVYDSTDCRFDAYDCISVVPGGTCTIKCKAPYTGSSVVGSCSVTNDRPNGLSLSQGLPTCILTSCADPYPVPKGFIKVDGKWRCDANYTDGGKGVKKTCIPSGDGECTASSVLSGCFPESPCAPLELTDQCWLNLTKCNGILPGGRCPVTCREGWIGLPGYAECPTGNTDGAAAMVLYPPMCECEEPFPVPPEYMWSKDDKAWYCAEGYAGNAMKQCLPGPNCTTVPVLVGCYAPVPCEVAPWEDKGSKQGFLVGTLRFGSAKVGDDITEAEVLGYAVYFADVDCKPFDTPIRVVPKQNITSGCCRDDIYAVGLALPVPAGAARLMIVANTTRGLSPDGGVVELSSLLGQFQDRVEFGFTLQGIAYDRLQAAPSVLHLVEVALRTAIAEEAGEDITPAHVAVELSAGSVKVDVRISPPFGVDAGKVQYKLKQNPSAINAAVRKEVSAVAGIDTVSTGPITVSGITNPTLISVGRVQVASAARRRGGPQAWQVAMLLQGLLVALLGASRR